MGGATSKEEQDIALKAASVPNGKPYFFLASCPEDSLRQAKALADKYGGFHCLDGDEGFDAWKGRAAGQFTTLKRLSPSGRKVIGIAIAGFGHCNDEREFLRQLGCKRGHEQFELKQCGDVKDMERWLQSEGYGSSEALVSQGTACPSPEESGRTQAVATDAGRAALWASVTSFFGSKAAAPGAWKERWLMDLQRALAEAESVDEASPEALRGASTGLSTALENARGAGVPEADLEATGAEKRREQLRQLLRAAERRQSCCGCWCCCTEARGLRHTDQQQETQVVFSTGGLDTKVLDTKLLDQTSQKLTPQGGQQGQGPGSQKLGSKARGLEEEKRDLSMKTVLPFQAHRDPLPAGTLCRYHSPRNGWLPAVVEGFNASDGTCNLDIKKHAKPENVFPATNVPKAQAWPPGTLVEYQSSSAGHWLEATICSFNEGVGKAECSYNLDVRQGAVVDRIRLRVP